MKELLALQNPLEEMNDLLQQRDDQLSSGCNDFTKPIVFIAGLPRAGSALLYQYLISKYDIGYVSNILARFWKAPVFGALLEQGTADPQYVSHFTSKYGNTVGPQDPHEWGWFWKEKLNLENGSYHVKDPHIVAGSNLREKLAALQQVINKPWIFDNVYASLNLTYLTHYLPEMKIILLRRDPYFLCNSMINARLDRHPGQNKLYSATPRSMEPLRNIEDPIESSVLQVKLLMDELNNQIDELPNQDILECSYEELIDHPEALSTKLENFLGSSLKRKDTNFSFNVANRNNISLVRPEIKCQLDLYFKKYFE